MIDTDSDAIAEIAYGVRFAASKGGGLTATVRRIDGTRSERSGDEGVVVVEGAAGAYKWFEVHRR